MDLKFIEHLIKDINVNTDKLLEILVQATNDNDDDVFRLLAYITDFTEKPEIKNTCKRYKGSELISYNIITNEVTFKYIIEQDLKVDESRLEDKVYKDYYDIPRDNAKGVTRTVEYYTTCSCYLNIWNA